MKKIHIASLIAFGFLISSCILPSRLLVNNKDDFGNKASIELHNQYEENHKKILQLFKNKKKFEGVIDISINTGSFEKNFSVKSNSAYIRKKIFLTGEHSTNQEHVKEKDRQIFDISKPQSLMGLTPYEGDFVDQTSNFKLSSLKINGTDDLKFEPEIILLELKDKSQLNIFKNLYDAEVIDELNGYYKLRVNLDKAPIKNIENLLNEYNKYSAVNITSVEFSSLASMKTFTIILDSILNHKDLIKNSILDSQSLELPTYEPSDLYKDSAPHKNIPLSGWWLKDTNVTNAWDYSLGTGITIAWLETNGFKAKHTEISRRVIDFGDNNVTNGSNSGNASIVDSENYVSSGVIKLLFDTKIAQEGQMFHGNSALMTCCAERDNGIGTVGVAPNVKVAPYSFQGLFSMAVAINRARKHKVDIIGINQSFPAYLWGLLSIAGDSQFSGISGIGPAPKEIESARSENIPVVVAAHNFGENLFGNLLTTYYPASDPNVITVGSITPNSCGSGTACSSYNVSWNYSKTATSFGNGNGSNYGKAHMVWAPGSNIDIARFETDLNLLKTTSYYKDPDVNHPIQLISEFSGTSSATPFSTAVIALMKARNPKITVSEIEDVLYNTNFPKLAKPHPNMEKDGFTDPVKIIDAKMAIEGAIKKRTTGSKDPNNFIAKDYYIYTDSAVDNTTLTQNLTFLNEKKAGKMLYTVDILGTRKDLPPSIFKHVVKLKGWDKGFIENGKKNNSIEMLTAEPINIAKRIDGIRSCVGIDCAAPNVLKESQEIIISGEGLFAPPNTYGKVHFEDIFNKDIVYTLDLDEDVNTYLSPYGTSMSFFLDTNKAKDSAGKTLKDASRFSSYKISFTTIEGETNKFAPATTRGGFSIESQPSTITIPTSNGGTEVVPVVTSGSKIIVTPNSKIAVPINDNIQQRLGNVFIGGKVALNLIKIIQNYAIYGLPDYSAESLFTIKNMLLPIIINDTSGNIILTLDEALQVASMAINLNPKYPDGSSILSRAPFLNDNVANDSNRVIKVKQGDVVALSISDMTTTYPKSITIYEANYGKQFDIYKRDGNIVYFTVSLEAPLGLNSIVFYDNDSTSSEGLIFHNAIEIIPADDTTTSAQNSDFITNSNTKVYLKFDEGSGRTIVDHSGYNNDATLNGNYIWNNGAKLDGVNSYLNIPNSTTLEIPNSISLEMVFSPNSEVLNSVSLANKCECRSGLYSNSSWSLFYNKNINSFELDLDSGNYNSLVLFGASQTLEANKKYYIQASWDYQNKKFNFVLNGKELQGSVLQGNFPPAYPDPNSFGNINISTMPIVIGAQYYAYNQYEPLSFGFYSNISINKFALHSEYRTPEQGIATSQKLNLVN